MLPELRATLLRQSDSGEVVPDRGVRPGYDCPLSNGCWKCIGCGKLLPQRLNWNQCGDCDTRYPEEMR